MSEIRTASVTKRRVRGSMATPYVGPGSPRLNPTPASTRTARGGWVPSPETDHHGPFDEWSRWQSGWQS